VSLSTESAEDPHARLLLRLTCSAETANRDAMAVPTLSTSAPLSSARDAASRKADYRRVSKLQRRKTIPAVFSPEEMMAPSTELRITACTSSSLPTIESPRELMACAIQRWQRLALRALCRKRAPVEDRLENARCLVLLQPLRKTQNHKNASTQLRQMWQRIQHSTHYVHLLPAVFLCCFLLRADKATYDVHLTS
jgi:hypothetical protein